MTDHKPPPRPTTAELAALDLHESTIEQIEAALEGDDNADDYQIACELLRRYRALEAELVATKANYRALEAMLNQHCEGAAQAEIRQRNAEEKLAEVERERDALQAFRNEWGEKDGNSPGYNLEKARTYGRIAYERKLELQRHQRVTNAAKAVSAAVNERQFENDELFKMLAEKCEAPDVAITLEALQCELVALASAGTEKDKAP